MFTLHLAPGLSWKTKRCANKDRKKKKPPEAWEEQTFPLTIKEARCLFAAGRHCKHQSGCSKCQAQVGTARCTHASGHCIQTQMLSVISPSLTPQWQRCSPPFRVRLCLGAASQVTAERECVCVSLCARDSWQVSLSVFTLNHHKDSLFVNSWKGTKETFSPTPAICRVQLGRVDTVRPCGQFKHVSSVGISCNGSQLHSSHKAFISILHVISVDFFSLLSVIKKKNH